MTTHEITVEPMTLNALFKKPLTIPDYQRPYSWKKEHVVNLLKSISHAVSAESRLLLGSIIIHKHETNYDGKPKQEWNIVDGQQRLVTLYILAKYVNISGSVCETIGNSNFAHGESQANIIANRKVITEWLGNQGALRYDNIKALLQERTSFTVVAAPTLDDAFIFFSSQNNRGKRLSDYDLVKANHLRFIEEDDLQKHCAESWERIERMGAEEQKKDSGICMPTMKYLMQGILGRVRQFALSRKYSLLEDFRCQRSEPRNRNDNYYYFCNYNQPPVFTRWRFDHKSHLLEGGGLELVFKHIDADQGTRRLRFETDSKRYMPFQITQSIEGGEQFFWFVDKYHAVYHDLFVTPLPTLPSAFLDIMRMTREIGGDYVRKFFEAVMVFYFDKFGCEDTVLFTRVTLYLQFAVYELQSRQRVQERSVHKFIRDTFNPFAWIHEASTPGFIVSKMVDNIDEHKWYRKKSSETRAMDCRKKMVALYSSLDGEVPPIACLAKQLSAELCSN